MCLHVVVSCKLCHLEANEKSILLSHRSYTQYKRGDCAGSYCLKNPLFCSGKGRRDLIKGKKECIILSNWRVPNKFTPFLILNETLVKLIEKNIFFYFWQKNSMLFKTYRFCSIRSCSVLGFIRITSASNICSNKLSILVK